MSVQSMEGMGKDFCPHFLQPFLENIGRRSCNDGSRELIPVFHNPHRKCRPSPSALARTLECLVGVPSYAASSWKEEKQVLMLLIKQKQVLSYIPSYQGDTRDSYSRTLIDQLGFNVWNDHYCLHACLNVYRDFAIFHRIVLQMYNFSLSK